MDKRTSLKSAWLFLLGFFLCFQAVAFAQSDETAPFYSAVSSYSNNGDAFEAEFRNGLRVIVEESFGVPLAAVTAVLTAGTPGESFVSGTAESWLEKVEPEILDIGGLVSTVTAGNRILIRTVAPAEEIEGVIEILSKMTSFKTPAGNVEPSFQSAPGEKVITGLDHAEIMALTLESLSAKREIKAAAKITAASLAKIGGLAVVGAVKHEEVLNYITEYFPNKPSAVSSVPASRVSGFDSETLNSVLEYELNRTDLDFPVFTVAYQVPPKNHSQRLSVEVLGKMIGGGLASLLRVSEEQYAVNVQHRVDIVDLESASFLIVTVAAHPEYLDKAEMLVLSTLSMLGKAEIPETLITRAKSLYLLDYFRELESQQSRADSWADKLARGEVRNRAFTIELLKELDRSDLKKAGAAYFDSGRAWIEEFIPRGLNRGFTPETFRETVGILLPLAMSAMEKRLEKLVFNEPEISFSVPEPASKAIPPELKKSSILRGPDIHLYEIHNSPLVEVGIYYSGGFLDEKPVDAGITETLLSSMLQHWSNDGLDREMISLEGKGCVVQAIVKPDYFGFRATVLSSNFESCFAELIQMITRFPVEEKMIFEYRNSRDLSGFLENPSDPAETAGGTIPLESGLLYDKVTESPGEPGKHSTLTSWYGRISGRHPGIVIYGDVKGTSFLRRMVPLLSNSSLRKDSVTRGRNRDIKRTKPLLVNQEDASICRFVTSGLPGNSGLGESLRIISRAYDGTGISINWITLVENGFGIVTSETGPGNPGSGCRPESILAEIRKKKFSTREYNQAKVRAITSYHMETENPFLMLDIITVGVLAGERGDFIRQHLVDLLQVRIVEAESVLETIFGE